MATHIFKKEKKNLECGLPFSLISVHKNSFNKTKYIKNISKPSEDTVLKIPFFFSQNLCFHWTYNKSVTQFVELLHIISRLRGGEYIIML